MIVRLAYGFDINPVEMVMGINRKTVDELICEAICEDMSGNANRNYFMEELQRVLDREDYIEVSKKLQFQDVRDAYIEFPIELQYDTLEAIRLSDDRLYFSIVMELDLEALLK